MDNIYVQPEAGWYIPYLQVKLDREAVASLDMQQSFMSAPLAPVRTADIRAMGDMIMLGISMEELRQQMVGAKARQTE